MRRRFKSGTGYPLTTSPRYLKRVNRRSEKTFDMRKPKRVRFVDGEMDGVPVHDSSEKCEATESPRSDAPKTSEFAYFRKVKSGAVHALSRSLHQENEKLKSSKINNLMTETCSALGNHKHSTKDLKISVSGERAGPSDHYLFLSPRVSNYDEPDQKKQTDKSEKRSSLLYENLTPVGQSSFSSPPYEASENSENEYSEKEIFSEKRHRLRQWAAHTLFSDAEKPHTKGFDFVSALMSRLFPKNNDNNDSSKRDADNSSKSLAFCKSNNNLDKGHYLPRKRDWDKDIPKIGSGRSNEIILSELDTFVSRFPFHNYGTESRVQDFLDQHPKTRIYNSSRTQNDFSFCVPFERYKSSGSFRFKGLDEFSSITDRPRDELYRPLLEWDSSEWGNDSLDSSIFNHNSTKNVHAEFSNYYLDFDSLPKNGSTGCLTQDFGPNFDDVKYALTEPGWFSLPLLSTPKCITLGEDRNDENILCNQNIVFSDKDKHWLKNKAWDGKPESDFWQKCLSASNFSTEDYPSIFHAWQYPQNDSSLYSFSRLKESPGKPISPFAEGAFFYHNLLPSNHQSSLDTFIDRPLLLDHVSCDRPDQDLCFGDEDNELEYR